MNPCRLLPFLVVVIVIAAGCTTPSTPPQAGPPGTPAPASNPSEAVARFTAGTNATLRELDTALAAAAVELAGSGIAGPAANTTLAGLASSSPYAVDAVTISPEGLIAAVMPEKYWGEVGVYVGNESHNRQALEERRPLMTPLFPAAEGFDAVSIRRPVFGAGGSFLGLVSVLVEPQLLLAGQADRALAGTDFTAWAMDTGAILIYDRDPSDLVGRNMITDPAYADYPGLVALVKRMIVEPAGTGTYSFTPTGGGAPVRKEAAWGTAGLHGTEWRLLVAREV